LLPEGVGETECDRALLVALEYKAVLVLQEEFGVVEQVQRRLGEKFLFNMTEALIGEVWRAFDKLGYLVVVYCELVVVVDDFVDGLCLESHAGLDFVEDGF